MSTENSKVNMIECESLVKIYKNKDIEVQALQGLDLIVETGELMAIIGNSGSGKSTLLNMLGGLDKPTAGKVLVDGKNLLKFNENELGDYKMQTVGFVWQNNARNLIPYLTAFENIELPLMFNKNKDRKKRVDYLLDLVGLSHRKDNNLFQMSGGEQQRVAIAIALANNPKLLLADEPTGSVDTKTTAQIMNVFRKVNKEFGITIVIVTHDRQISKMVDRVVSIKDGRTSSELIRKKTYCEELKELSKGVFQDEESHVELAVIDKVGRLQIPKEYLEALNLGTNNKVKVEIDNDKIIIFNHEK